NGDEGAGEGPLTEKVADGIGDAQRDAECVRRPVIAQVVREQQLADVPQDPGQEDAGGDLRRLAAAGPRSRHGQEGLVGLGFSRSRCMNWSSSRVAVSFFSISCACANPALRAVSTVRSSVGSTAAAARASRW